MARPLYIDAHLHLQDTRFARTADAVIERALAAGVKLMACNATREQDWRQVLELAAHPQITPALGIHPWYAHTAAPGWDERLDSLCREAFAAIGECGLDKFCKVETKLQERIFIRQLEIAAGMRCTATIHCVGRWGRLLEILRGFAPLPFIPIIHSFSGSREVMAQLLGMGAYISFSSRLAEKGQEKLRQAFAAAPIDRIFLETDAPDQLSPTLHHPAPANGLNEPALVTALYGYAARLREMGKEEFAGKIHDNATIFTHRTSDRQKEAG